MINDQPIGVFDSGVGGLSVLREACRVMPDEDFVYFGDTARAPYGTKTRDEICFIARDVVERLNTFHVKGVIIACNTCTSIMLEELRKEYPFPIMGIHPSLETAAQMKSKDGLILSLATPATVNSASYRELLKAYGNGVISLGCDGLMEFVERGETDSPELHRYLSQRLDVYRDKKVDVVVLGCTHYPFVGKAIAQHLPNAVQTDGSHAVCTQMADELARRGLTREKGKGGHIRFYSSGGPDAVRRMKKLFYTEE